MRYKSLYIGFISLMLLMGSVFGTNSVEVDQSPQDAPIILRLHQFLPLHSTIPDKAIAPWIARIEAQSAGRVQIQHFPSMQLGGSPASLYSQARDGVVDIVWTVLGYTPGLFPVLEAFELPFMVTNGEATSQAFHEYARRYAMAELSDIHPLILHTHGPGLFHLRGQPIQGLGDMQGKKLRGPTRIITAMLDQLGATAIGMPVPAVPESLSRGVIDGAVIPWQVTIALRIPELVDSHTEFSGTNGLYTATFGLLMNKKRYESLPDDIKAILDANSTIEDAALFGQVMDADDIIGREHAIRAGNEIVVLPEEEVRAWRKAAKPVIDEWVERMNAEGRDGNAMLEEARRLITHYSDGQ